MNTLRAGFSRVNITPTLGAHLMGYHVERPADGVLDALELNTLALACGEYKVLLMSVDSLGMSGAILDGFRQHIQAVTGIPSDRVFIHSTHSHTAPWADPVNGDDAAREYHSFLHNKMADGAVLALNDLKKAKMGYAVGNAPHIAFVRRFRMKDGSVRTNPGVGNPDILHPLGDVNENVNVLRFDRAGGDTIVLANFGCHPDTVGGTKVSADWPGFFRRRLEKSLDNVKAIFFNGAEGDVNHVNVWPTAGDHNDLTRDFDDVDRGYGHARHMGNVVAAGVLQVFDKVNYVEVDRLHAVQKVIKLASNKPNPEDLPQARKYYDLHMAGRDDEIPFKGMELTTVVSEAMNMIAMEKAPDAFNMLLSAVVIGNVAIMGIPGEPFNGVGVALQEAPGWDLTLTCCLTNGYEGYFPMKDAYDEGGYEARHSRYKAGVAENIIQESIALLESMR